MNRLFRWYYNNKMRFWIIVFAIVGVYALIHLLNNYAMNNENATNKVNINTSLIVNSSFIDTTESVISNTEKSEQELNEANGIINKFINYCNEDNIEMAYNLLSNDCKEEQFKTLNSFKQIYYDKIFSTNKTYKIKNWSGNIYYIELKEDLLDTGGASQNILQDFFTVVTENEQTKLNINGYIGKEILDKEYSSENLLIKVKEKYVYMDYEVYNFEIQNKTDNDILLDSLENSKSIYLVDENGKAHYAYSNELYNYMLKVENRTSINLKIKFTNSYVTGRRISEINFSDVILNIEDYTNRSNLSISL